MLILSRRMDEVILIGDDIRLTVVDISSNQVKIGIDAPREKTILREEILKNKVVDKHNEEPA